jgi:signal transduction histidine kinase
MQKTGPAAETDERLMFAASNKTGSSALRYLGGVSLTALGLVLVYVSRDLPGIPAALVFAATVALTARFFGLGPSLLASALAILAIDWATLPEIGHIELSHPEEITYSVVFGVLSLIISGTTHSLMLARAAAESHVTRLEEANKQVELQMEETRVVSEDLAHANDELTHARDAAERVTLRTQRLLAVTTALSEASLPADVARVVVTQGFDVLEAVAGLVASVDGDDIRVIDRRRSPRATGDRSLKITLQDDTPLATALRRREPVWLESPDQYRERFPRAADRFQPQQSASAVLALPLVYGDRLIGGLVLGFEHATALGATDHAFAQLLAQSVGSALARALSFEQERHGRRDAEMMSRAREEVLGVVAHDLRNPLGVAASVLQMLSEDGLGPAERERLLSSGVRSVHQMNRLIGDLLDVMRMEAGRLALDVDELSVATIVAQAEESARHLADERHIELTVSPPDPSSRLRGDRGRLAQVFGNLLGNAIKFTPEGGKVSLRAWREGSEIVFEVADTGPGVSPEHLSHLFDRFWQANRTDRRGVGLGLPITKGIVDAHGGRLWVESQPGAGSHFFVALPALG